MPSVDFYFDYSSPFAYLGSARIEGVAADAGAELTWRPFLLGGLFKLQGGPMVPLLEFSEHKRAYVMRDLGRFARHFDIPFKWPSRFPMQTVAALRITLLLDEPSPFIHRVFRAYWGEDQDISNPVVLRRLCEELGLPGDLVDRTSDPAVKQMLIETTQAANDAGVFGAPTSIVDGQLYWGQDRLNFVALALKRVDGAAHQV